MNEFLVFAWLCATDQAVLAFELIFLGRILKKLKRKMTTEWVVLECGDKLKI